MNQDLQTTVTNKQEVSSSNIEGGEAKKNMKMMRMPEQYLIMMNL